MKALFAKETKMMKWFKRIGIWGFLFFLLKGLLWLALGAGVFSASGI